MTLTELTDQREFESTASENKNNNLELSKSKNSSQPNSAGPKRVKSRSFLSRFSPSKKSQSTTKSHSPKGKKEDKPILFFLWNSKVFQLEKDLILFVTKSIKY